MSGDAWELLGALAALVALVRLAVWLRPWRSVARWLESGRG